MSKVIVVGAGAAGMMAAYFAAKNKNKVTLIEKNEKTGKKIYITGKGRCNITNACDVEDLFANVMSNKKFLYSAFYGFTNSDVIDFLKTMELRQKLKEETGYFLYPIILRMSYLHWSVH